ncbi:endonuclease MutS2 [Geobacter pelophilus]|uniref:Endonuclease MutS2 n=1 Tax=Geoanaerobacter pelophilus TaxID=60036 RepID=A0AAW4L3G5_9BACT|nr:endonuclease MutS2 [Geoanaerobacter pelophilus]MBT0665428.1 endonuclease MutS2 [Geoanaerobacter pelophilus]
MISTDTLKKLEFTKLLERIAVFAHSAPTQEQILAIAPFSAKEEIALRFGQVAEIRTLERIGITLRLSQFEDILQPLDLLRPADSVLNPLDLQLFIPPFQLLSALSRQFANREDIPLLKRVGGELTGFPEILNVLERTIDHDGSILDSASRLLKELRQRKRSLTSRIRKRLEEIVRERSVAIFLQDDFITQRSGRWVIPVRMDSKGMVPGVVHDVSNTGETAFMEPIEIIALANELENLVAEEKAEQIRIIREICSWIREDAAVIEAEFAALVRIDLLNSLALFAGLVDAEIPSICDGPELKLDGARHPLLLLFSREHNGPAVVPLDLVLGGDSDCRTMIITGPNTGGKTIAIKTAGLLTLMAISGIPVPAASTSLFPLVTDMQVDIGDDQAIERSLSTFSAHLSRIAEIIRNADDRTLVLMDELGTGTEPVQGAALACAVLKELHQRGGLVLATTHLTEIVGYVHRFDGMQNAAMEFDRTSLMPLYRLTVGEPGESHAIETARRYGIPDHVVDHAQSLVGRVGSEFHALLAELKEQRQAYEERLNQLAAREADLVAREQEQRRLLAETDERRRVSLEKGWQEAKELVQATRRELNRIVEEARKEKREAAALERLREKELKVEQALRAFSGGKALAPGTVREGSKVHVVSLGCEAKVLKLDSRQGRARVRAGNLEIEVPLDDLSPSSGKAAKGELHPRRSEVDSQEAAREINLIGKRVEEAIAELEPFLNHAALEGYHEVRVIHGIGTGALKRGLRGHLTGHPLVAVFRDGESYEGGGGATVVTLR